MAESPITNVQDTAIWIAHFRAVESARPDRLFKDPFAARLAGSRGGEIARKMPGGRTIEWSVALRTMIIDEYIHAALADGFDTVVNLGAGLDARPYRMDLPTDLRWIEVDYPDMIAYKSQQLAPDKPRCRLERVPLDLADRAQRQRLFSDIASQSKNALILTEGVIPYLDSAAVATLADDLAAVPAFRRWIVDYFAPQLTAHMMRGRLQRKMQHAPFKFHQDDWTGFFARHGWRVRQMRYLGEEGQAIGRPGPLPLYVKLLFRFAPKEKRLLMNRMTGYALLERA